MKDERSRYEITRNNYVASIAEEKQKEKPDKAVLKQLHKNIIQLEKNAFCFTGKHNDKKPPRAGSGKRNYQYAKWVKDDEQNW